MKIVQIITGAPSFGGAQSHVRDLAAGIRDRGHDCTVLVGPPEGLFCEQLRSQGIPVVVLPALRKSIHPLRDLASLLQIVAVLKRLKPDILAAHTAKAGFLGRMAGRILNIPCFFTPHGLSFFNRETGRQQRLFLVLERLAARLGNKFITVCHAERHLALQHMRIDPREIVTIHNGIPDCQMLSDPKRAPAVITMIARFDRQKDHATFLRALATLKHLSWEVRLAGTGPLLEPAKMLASALGIAPRIRFLGECPDPPRLLADSQIFVLITNWEAFPISILEAMRSGLPVLATKTGGVSEAVEDGVTGFLVPPGDSLSLARRLASLIGSADLRCSLGAQARTRYQQSFALSSMLEKTLAIYAEALSHKLTEEYPFVNPAQS